jgi:2-polyprenyl-3-methyl-5-hydroxy-6-metoxy-1,4-benzoquinol methylase
MGLITAKGNRINIWAPEQLHHLNVFPVCLSRKTDEIALRLDGLNICECLVCRIGYVNPKPSSEQIRCYNDKDYFTGRKDFFAKSNYCWERDNALKSGRVTGHRELVSCVEIKNKVILEIGCGSGSLLCALKPQQPAELIGIDVAKYPIEYGRNRYGLDLRQQALDEADFPSGSFDLVLMIDVIEHIELLSDFIQQVHCILNIVDPKIQTTSVVRLGSGLKGGHDGEKTG